MLHRFGLSDVVSLFSVVMPDSGGLSAENILSSAENILWQNPAASMKTLEDKHMFEAVSMLDAMVSERARIVHSNANRLIVIYLRPLHAVVGTFGGTPTAFLCSYQFTYLLYSPTRSIGNPICCVDARLSSDTCGAPGTNGRKDRLAESRSPQKERPLTAQW